MSAKCKKHIKFTDCQAPKVVNNRQKNIFLMYWMNMRAPPKQNGSRTPNTATKNNNNNNNKIGRMHSKLSMTLRIMIVQKYSCLIHWWVSFAYWRRAREEKKQSLAQWWKEKNDCWHASYNIKHYTVHDFHTPKGVAVKKRTVEIWSIHFFNVQQQTNNNNNKKYQRENIWKFYGLRFLRSHDCCCSTQNGV